MNSRLVAGTLWLTCAKFLTTAIGFLSTIILARILVPQDFGLIAIATATIAIVNAVTEVPVVTALVQLEKPTRADYDTTWTVSVLRGLLIVIALVGISPLIAAAYGDDRLLPVLLALSASPLLMGAVSPAMVNFERELLYSKIFILDISAKVGSAIVAAVVAFVFRTYWALVIAPLTSALLMLTLSYVMAPYRPRISFVSLRTLWNFASWLTLVSIVNTMNQRIDQFVVGHVLGQRTLGHFSVGSDIAGLVHAPVLPMMRTLYSGFSRLRGDGATLFIAYRKSQRFLCSIVLPFGVGLALIAEPMVRLAMGEMWVPGAIVIQILAPVFALELIAGATYPLVMSQGNTQALFWRDLSVFLFRLPLMIVGLVYFGLPGLLAARAIASVLGLVLNVQLADKAIGFSFRDVLSGVWRPLCGVAAMTCAAIALHTMIDSVQDPLLFILVTVPICALAYSTCVIVLWLISGESDSFEADAIAFVRGLPGR